MMLYGRCKQGSKEARKQGSKEARKQSKKNKTEYLYLTMYVIWMERKEGTNPFIYLTFDIFSAFYLL